MARDDRRRVSHRRLSVGEHFALEAPELRALPDEPFEVSVVATHRVDRKARVSVRGCLYSVPARYVGRRLEVRVGRRDRRGPRRGPGGRRPCPSP